MPIPLLLDTDIGDDVDDVFALLLAAGHPDLHLIGVTTVFGDVRERARLARRMLDLDGHADVPVAVGAGVTSLGRDPTGTGGATMASADTFIANHAPGKWSSLDQRIDRRDAVDFLADAIRGAQEPPVLAAIGPLTNVAALFERVPETIQRLRALVLMGGKLGEGAEGGEHNFNSDSPATAAVLASGAHLIIGTYEITRQATLGREDLPRLRAGTPACQAAATQLERYLDRRNRDCTSMYDPLSLTLAYTQRYVMTRPAALRWTAADRVLHLTEEPGAAPNAEVSSGLDAAGFQEHLLEVIGAGGPHP